VPLNRGEAKGYDFDRMVYGFTMLDNRDVVEFAISSAAMDDLEGVSNTRPHQRDEQFARLRNIIEERAARKFYATQPAQRGKAILLRSVDFRR
jgi:hypothetical protein